MEWKENGIKNYPLLQGRGRLSEFSSCNSPPFRDIAEESNRGANHQREMHVRVRYAELLKHETSRNIDRRTSWNFGLAERQH